MSTPTTPSTSDLNSYLSQYYDRFVQREWERLDRHRTEFALTVRALQKWLQKPPARILDCGSGPGRLAFHLSQQGYEVTLFDLSPKSLELAEEKFAAAGLRAAGLECGSAVDLSRFADSSFDAVLMLGPLYHLLEPEERLRAVKEAVRVLRPGGVLFAAFICRFTGHRWAVHQDPQWVLQHPEAARHLLATGKLLPRDQQADEFCAYMAHPSEITPLLEQADLEIKTLLALEGLASQGEQRLNELQGEDWQTWVEINESVASDPSLFGSAEHLMAVAEKPGWRTVLQNLAGDLNQGGLEYKVVGGASLALRGILKNVKDIDLETTKESALRFQSLYSQQCVDPVTLKEGRDYRSYFGKYDFDGVVIEVMGDLHRWEAGNWRPSSTSTKETVMLAGTPVAAAWLEEETLAYIRRGRMDRAAACLPRCNPERMLSLLRGETKTCVY